MRLSGVHESRGVGKKPQDLHQRLKAIGCFKDLGVLRAQWLASGGTLSPPDAVVSAFLKPFYHFERELNGLAATAEQRASGLEKLNAQGDSGGRVDTPSSLSPPPSPRPTAAPKTDTKVRELHSGGPCKHCKGPTSVPFKPKFQGWPPQW